MVEFTKTVSEAEERSKYLNLTDDLGESYGHFFPSHRTRFVVVDSSGRHTNAQMHHGNQIWGSLRHWFDSEEIEAGNRIEIAFDESEWINGKLVLHLRKVPSTSDISLGHTDVGPQTGTAGSHLQRADDRIDLAEIARAFAEGLVRADRRAPVAHSVRSKKAYQPGIGPHSEAAAVELVAAEMRLESATRYRESLRTSVPYPGDPRMKCDLVVEGSLHWAIEVKLFRMLGDNGKVNDHMITHILSPYMAHRSALTDSMKLITSQGPGRKAILIYGFEADGWPLDPILSAFEGMIQRWMPIGPRAYARFEGLMHPFHQQGAVAAWEIAPTTDDSTDE